MDLSGCQTQMSDTHFSQNKSSKSKQNFCFLIYFLQEGKKIGGAICWISTIVSVKSLDNDAAMTRRKIPLRVVILK